MYIMMILYLLWYIKSFLGIFFGGGGLKGGFAHGAIQAITATVVYVSASTKKHLFIMILMHPYFRPLSYENMLTIHF